ncbi:MAG: hypothetical protein JSR53_06555 [Proteobacteria bacterium]|nr:hypothetical protein [Pseudomonadota bacterium]
MGVGTRDSLIRDFKTYGQKTPDVAKLNDAVSRVVKREDAGYAAWVNQQLAGLFDEPTLRCRVWWE